MAKHKKRYHPGSPFYPWIIFLAFAGVIVALVSLGAHMQKTRKMYIEKHQCVLKGNIVNSTTEETGVAKDGGVQRILTYTYEFPQYVCADGSVYGWPY